LEIKPFTRYADFSQQQNSVRDPQQIKSKQQQQQQQPPPHQPQQQQQQQQPDTGKKTAMNGQTNLGFPRAMCRQTQNSDGFVSY
jgi:outer membrane biosynthesis protein TonB